MFFFSPDCLLKGLLLLCTIIYINLPPCVNPPLSTWKKHTTQDRLRKKIEYDVKIWPFFEIFIFFILFYFIFVKCVGCFNVVRSCKSVGLNGCLDSWTGTAAALTSQIKKTGGSNWGLFFSPPPFCFRFIFFLFLAPWQHQEVGL